MSSSPVAARFPVWPQIPARIPNRHVPRLGEHCQWWSRQTNPARSAHVYADNLDRRRRAIQSTRRFAPRSRPFVLLGSANSFLKIPSGRPITVHDFHLCISDAVYRLRREHGWSQRTELVVRQLGACGWISEYHFERTYLAFRSWFLFQVAQRQVVRVKS